MRTRKKYDWRYPVPVTKYNLHKTLKEEREADAIHNTESGTAHLQECIQYAKFNFSRYDVH